MFIPELPQWTILESWARPMPLPHLENSKHHVKISNKNSEYRETEGLCAKKNAVNTCQYDNLLSFYI
jgi:hypothetical protein